MRRVFLIILAIIVLIGLALGIYMLFFSAKAPDFTANPGSFGTGGEYVPGEFGEPGEGEVGETETEAGEEVAPRLVKITDGPVAFGSVAFTTEEVVEGETVGSTTASSTVVYDTEVRYVERLSGNVYGYKAHERTLTRISNRTLPGVYEASWLSDGSTVYARFLTESGAGDEVLETYALPVQEGEGGYFLEPNIAEVAVRGTTTVATLLPSSSGSLASASSADGATVRTLFTSSLSALQLLASNVGYAAYTNASAQSGGYGFLISETGVFERLVGPLRGLTLLPSPSGSYVFYTYLSGSTLRSELLETTSRVSTTIPLGALSEKCVWAPDESSIYCAVPRSVSGTLPDDWYQGVVSFSDRIWKVDLGARVAVLVVDPLNAGGVAIDAVNLAIDPREDTLVFTNKKDDSLWAYDL